MPRRALGSSASRGLLLWVVLLGAPAWTAAADTGADDTGADDTAAGDTAADDTAADIEYGRYLAADCTTCHLESGASEGIPSITGWPAADFAAAFEAYRSGLREHDVMGAIARRFEVGEIAALAAYFETLGKADAER
ncbi:hypothetical protein BH23PSE1_BH23PSE1_10860 [soil metagenome]